MAVSIEAITPAIGAIIGGVDLARPLDAGTQAAITAALLDHQLLFFRDQDISQQQQRDFAARFGPLHIHPIYPASDTVPEIIILDTARTDLHDNALWHSDVSFVATPPLGAVLVAKLLPEIGGDTLWLSAAAAYDGLPANLQQFLGGLRAIHDLAKSFPVERFGSDADSLARLEQAKRANPPVSHPVIRTHPVTGRKAIYVSEGFTTRIEGLDADASDALLALLFRHLVKPEYALRWRWRAGDVAFWDNRITQHYATDDYRPQRRVMNRATIVGDQPV